MAALHARCFTVPRPWDARAFAELLASPLAICLGQVEGFLIGRVVADEAEVLTLAVDPAARRQGVGAGLVRAFLAQGAERGAVRAFLEVAETNSAARALYAGQGFAEVGRRRNYYAAGPGGAVDALVLARLLGADRGGATNF